MDNKITKRRLSDFLAYEWIKIIIVCVVVILVWEAVYAFTSVKPTTGQKFKYYFDTSVYGDATKLNGIIEGDDALSYDILSFTSEQLSTTYNTLPTRLDAQEGDIMITDCREMVSESYSKGPFVRAKFVVDNYYSYAYENLLADAQDYLFNNFIKDGVAKETVFASFNEDNLDFQKISAVFRSRMAKDNRFRTEAQKTDGVYLEKDRITKLYKEVVDFAKLLSLRDTDPDLFMIYTKYEQSLTYNNEVPLSYWEEVYEREVAAGRVNMIYALRLDVLKKYQGDGGDKVDPSYFVYYYGEYAATDVCMTVFDFRSYQPHLQFETISFVNAVVRACSTILD